MQRLKESESRQLGSRRCQQTAQSRITCPQLFVYAVILLNWPSSQLCNAEKGSQEHIHTLEGRHPFDITSDFIWSHFLEDYVLSQSPRVRTTKDLPLLSFAAPTEMPGASESAANSLSSDRSSQVGSILYHPSLHKRYIPTNNAGIYVERLDEQELNPHRQPAVQVVSPLLRPMTSRMQQQPALLQSLFGLGAVQQQHTSAGTQAFRAVSENDLYLLGAIEKLVYRVEHLESRVRRSEQLIYYLMAGNQRKEARDPCPRNFSRIGDNCYHVNSHSQANWKTANLACKALNAHLAELDKTAEKEKLIAHMLSQPNERGRDFWLGGLNPGLLWIWANSAKPVDPNTNLTSMAITQNGATAANANAAHPDGNLKDGSAHQESNETLLNNTFEIKGQGRCLRLSYNSSTHSFVYYGQECTSRHNYICEHEDKTLDNNIRKLARKLKL